MNTLAGQFGILIVAFLILSLPVLIGCGGNGEKTPDATPEPTLTDISKPTAAPSPTPAKEVTLTIGFLSDLTGGASGAMLIVGSALADIVAYANQENLIPGVKLDILTYDGQYDPAKDIPGYEWLKERGTDIYLCGLPNTPVMLKPRVDREQVVLIALTAGEELFDPPGYVFSLGNSPSTLIKTLLEWIAENDWDWKARGPATVGAAGWDVTYFIEIQRAAEEYVDAHPEQFRWARGFLVAPSTFHWAAEADALRDVDFVIPPGAPWATFAREYYAMGGKARHLCTDAQTPFIGLTAEVAGWNAIDGALIVQPIRWWNEDAEISNLANLLVRKNHSDAEDIIEKGMAYIGAIHQAYGLIQIIKETVDNVGPENFSQQALYDTLIAFRTSFGEGYPEWGYSETKRDSWNYLGMYRISASERDVVRADPAWHPVVK